MSASSIKAGGAEIEIGAKDVTSTVFNRLKSRIGSLGGLSSAVSGIGKSAFSKLSSGLSMIASAAKIASVGVGVLVGTMAGLGTKSLLSIAKTGDQFDKMALRTGASVEALSQWAFAAQQSGSSIESVERSMNRTTKFMRDLERGTKESKQALDDLGLTSADLQGLSPEDAFMLLGQQLDKVPDKARRTALTMEIMGKSANELTPLFMAGAAGIKALKQESDELGGTVTRTQADIGAGLTDAFGRLSTASEGAFRRIGEKIGPIFITLINKTASTIASIGPKLAEIGLKIISIFGAVADSFGPIFAGGGETILGFISDTVDAIPAILFDMYRYWEELVTGIGMLWLKTLAYIEKGISQLMSGELLLKAQGTVADLIIDLQTAAGFFTEAQAADIKKTRREDTERTAKNDPAIAEAREKQKKITDDLEASLGTMADELDKKLESINEKERNFNLARDRNAGLGFSIDGDMFRNMFDESDLAEEIGQQTKLIPDFLQRGTLEAYKQGEANKKDTASVVNAVNNVGTDIRAVNDTLNDKLNFEMIG